MFFVVATKYTNKLFNSVICCFIIFMSAFAMKSIFYCPSTCLSKEVHINKSDRDITQNK